MKNLMKISALLAVAFVIQSGVVVAQNVCYGDVIKLKHRLTSKFLASKSQNYSHTGSSQQQMVGAINDDQATTWWIVKGPQAANNRFNITTWGAPVNKDAIIRLEHVATGKNLHSHNLRSPVTQQQEVTGLGNTGLGDDNCNWKVATIKNTAGTAEVAVLQKDAQVLFMHNLTNTSLHSHNVASAATTGNMQEVTCYNQRDDNDWWFVADVVKPQMCWGVNAAQQVWCRDGVSSVVPAGLLWTQIDGQLLSHVSARDNLIWGVYSKAGKVWFRNGVTADNPRGTGWVEVTRPATNVYFKQISVGSGGSVFAVASNGAIYCRTGITAAAPQGTGWQAVEGALSQICVK